MIPPKTEPASTSASEWMDSALELSHLRDNKLRWTGRAPEGPPGSCCESKPRRAQAAVHPAFDWRLSRKHLDRLGFIILLLAVSPALAAQSPDPLEDALVAAIPGMKAMFYAMAGPVIAAVPVSDADEAAAGKIMARAFKAHAKAPLDRPGRDLDQVRTVGAAVARHARRKGLRWTFHFIESDEINAFSHAGGHVYLYRGLLRRLENEAQLAAVLGHEIAHVDLKHTQDAIRPLVAARQLQGLVPGVAVDTVRLAASLVQAAATTLYSEPQEYEADAAGLRLAFEAGYDPREAARLWTQGPFSSPRGSARATHLLLQSHPQALARAAEMNRVADALVQSAKAPLRR